MKAVKFLAKLLLGALAAVAVGTLIIGPFALSLWLFGEIRLHRDDRLPIISFADFLPAGGWMQAVVAWGTLVVTVVGATSIFLCEINSSWIASAPKGSSFVHLSAGTCNQ